MGSYSKTKEYKTRRAEKKKRKEREREIESEKKIKYLIKCIQLKKKENVNLFWIQSPEA